MQTSVEECGAVGPQLLKCTGTVSKYRRFFGQGHIKACVDGCRRKILVKKSNIVSEPKYLQKDQEVSFDVELPLTSKTVALNVTVQYGEGVAVLSDTTETYDRDFDAVLLHSNESLSLSGIVHRDRSTFSQEDRNEVIPSGISSSDSILSSGTHVSIEETTIQMEDASVRFVVEEIPDLGVLAVERS